MSKSKPYSAVPVNRVVLEQLTRGRAGQEVVVGFDIGTFAVLAMPRWGTNDFARPWSLRNPEQIPEVVGVLVPLAPKQACPPRKSSKWPEKQGISGFPART